MKAFYAKRMSDEAYRAECDAERDATFTASDFNSDRVLQLDEYKVFCRKQVANISARTGVDMKTASEEHMEIAWKINQFSGKGGINEDDFKLKVRIDGVLTAELRAAAQANQ
jgi:hypothetical protein